MKVKLTWETEFKNEEEYQIFVNEIAMIHSKRYFTNCTYKPLKNNGYYKGSVNTIKISRLT